MCWPVIIASALSRGSRDFTRELPLIGPGSAGPRVFWKTSEQKAECQFNWCVCGSRCTLLTGCKLVPGCSPRTKGLTRWYVRTSMISYCVSERLSGAECCSEREQLCGDTLLHFSWGLRCVFLHCDAGCTVRTCTLWSPPRGLVIIDGNDVK